MTEPTFSLSIPHTPWRPERLESMARLTATLAESQGDAHVIANVFDERLPNHEWAFKLWTWAAAQDATHALVLQDDVIPAPNFWPALRAMVEAVPDQVICLEVVHPSASMLAAAGHRWFTTSDGMVGVGYVVPTALLREFLAWRSTALKPGAIRAAQPGEVQEINEDTLLALWGLSTGRKVWHPIPTLIDHDTSMSSSYGNDGHQARRPAVRWDTQAAMMPEARDLADPRTWYCTDTPPPHLGRMPWRIAELAAKWVEGFTSDDLVRATADDGRRLKRAMALRARARNAEEDSKRLLYVATPSRGSGRPEFTATIAKLVAWGDVWLDNEIFRVTLEGYDVVRRRSRMVRAFLASPCTHLLFVDDDVSFEPEVVHGMLSLERDFVAAPYAKRQGIDWSLEGKPDPMGRTMEQRAYTYAVAFHEGPIGVDAQGCIDVAGIGLGCALISRACLERMADAYGGRALSPQESAERYVKQRRASGFPELDTADVAEAIAADRTHVESSLYAEDELGPFAALFQLAIRGVCLLSEDLSFARRWRDIGGKVWCYVGPGSPIDHYGVHRFTGHLEAFGLVRRQR